MSHHPPSDFVCEALRRQGVSLPPERLEAVAATSARLTETGRLLEKRLALSDDIYGFLTHLASRAAPR